MSLLWPPRQHDDSEYPLYPPSWTEQALCAEVDPEIFFPEKGGSTRDPKRICRPCDVRAECLEFALDSGEKFGVWGGFSERERRAMKPQAAPNQPQKVAALCIPSSSPPSRPVPGTPACPRP